MGPCGGRLSSIRNFFADLAHKSKVFSFYTYIYAVFKGVCIRETCVCVCVYESYKQKLHAASCIFKATSNNQSKCPLIRFKCAAMHYPSFVKGCWHMQPDLFAMSPRCIYPQKEHFYPSFVSDMFYCLFSM